MNHNNAKFNILCCIVILKVLLTPVVEGGSNNAASAPSTVERNVECVKGDWMDCAMTKIKMAIPFCISIFFRLLHVFVTIIGLIAVVILLYCYYAWKASDPPADDANDDQEDIGDTEWTHIHTNKNVNIV